MTVAELRAFLRTVDRTPGMWTLEGTFPEVCALVNGATACTGLAGLSTAFHDWVLERTDTDRPELAWPSLVCVGVFDDATAWRNATAEQNATLNAALFRLLDEFLATWVRT